MSAGVSPFAPGAAASQRRRVIGCVLAGISTKHNSSEWFYARRALERVQFSDGRTWARYACAEANSVRRSGVLRCRLHRGAGRGGVSLIQVSLAPGTMVGGG